MIYSTTLRQFKEEYKKRLMRDILHCFIVVVIICALLGLFKPSKLVSTILGVIVGNLSMLYVIKDLNRFKAMLLKNEIHNRIKDMYVNSDKVNCLYYSKGLPSNVVCDTELYVNNVLGKFRGVIGRTDLKILVVNESIQNTINKLFKRVSKSFNSVDEDISGVYLNELDCIIVNYFGLSVNSSIGHEFVHFLLNKSNDKILKDKEYISYFNTEKDAIFKLDYEEYYKDNISEFTAELGSRLIEGDTKLLGYSSGRILSTHLEKYFDYGFSKKQLH